MNKIVSGMNKIGSGITISDPVWINSPDSFPTFWDLRTKGGYISFTRNFRKQSRRQSANEERCDGPCRTEALAMPCVGFGLFHNISIKTIFFNGWQFLLKFLKNLTSGTYQHFHWFLRIFSTHSRHIWLQRGTWFYRQHLWGQSCKNNKIAYQWLNVEQKNVCLLWRSVENSDAALTCTDL